MSKRLAGLGAVVLLALTDVLSSYGAGSPIAAQQVRACMKQHHLALAHDVLRPSSSVRLFVRCDWPPPRYADPTGYTQIHVRTVAGPGQDNASDSDLADLIDSTCRLYRIAYSYGSQGAFTHLRPFTARPNLITWEDTPGKPWRGDKRTLPFYPARGEVVYLHNDRQVIDSATCMS